MFLQLIRSVLRGSSPGGDGRGRRRSISLLSLLAIAATVGTLYAGAPLDASHVSARDNDGVDRALPEAVLSAELAEMEARMQRLRTGWAELSDYYRSEIAPIRRVLLRYHSDETLADQVAVALVREANEVGLQPRLLLAVLLVENPWLDPEIRSSVGAVGLMQVMPFHRGAWGCEPDLEDIDANICHGARIFAHYFRQSGGNVERALLRYNGCVTGTNTPDCHQYPYHVFARAGRASVLAWLEDAGPAAASR